MASLLLLLVPRFGASGQIPGNPAPGENPPADGLPDPPASRILDEGRVFAFARESYQRISTMLQNASREHGLDIYVAASSFLLNETIEERARALQQKWVSGNKGLVLCYVSGNEQMTFAATEDMHQFLSKFELMEIFNEAAAQAKLHETPPERIETAVAWLAENLSTKLAAKEEHKSFLHQDIIILLGVLALASAVILGAGFIVARIQRRSDDLDSQFYYFPRVNVGCRYGGTFAGGACAVIDYKSKERPAGQPQPPESGAPFEA